MVHISTFETLDDDQIEDEYDIDEMESLDMLSRDEGNIVPEPVHAYCYWLDNPAFSDISAWDANRPIDADFLGVQLRYARDSLYKGQIWETKGDAKYTVQLYSIAKRVEFRIDRSTPNFVTFVCKSVGQNCPWEIRIAQRANTSYWTLTQYKGDHVCNRTIILKDNIHLSKSVIAKHFETVLREDLRLETRRIQADVEKDFGYQIQYIKAWQAKQEAMENVFGKWDESFSKLPQLMDVLQDSNPGTFVKWCREDMGGGCTQVNRVFWAFGPAIKAFVHCRPVLSVDGTHLYGKYNGRLLVAIAVDADNQLMPLAFALVESENNSSWKWFMRCLREGATDRDGLCIISDRHKGILSAMNTMQEWMPPRAYHRFCLRHMVSNFNQKLGNERILKRQLGLIGYIADPLIFDQAYSNLLRCMQQHPRTREWLNGISFDKWTLAYDEGRRWGAMTTNSAECFNKILKSSRDLPICALVRFTFMQSNKYFVSRRELYADYPSPFPPKLDTHFQELIEQAKFFRCVLFDRDEMIVRVQDGGIDNYSEVNMSAKTCTCGKFVAHHYPCNHALAVCRDYRLDFLEFVPTEYTLEAYRSTWSYVFNIPPRESSWPDYTGPMHYPNPEYRRAAAVGRHPTRRIRNEMDWPDSQPSQLSQPSSGEASGSRQPRRTQHCRNCGVEGHNARRCPLRNCS